MKRRGFASLGSLLAARIASAALALSLMAGSTLAAGPEVKNVRIGTFDDHTRVVIKTNAPVAPRLFTLSEPERLVVDLPEIDWNIPKPEGRVASRLVETYRFGLYEPGVSRLVFNLTGPAKVDRVESRSAEDGTGFVLDVRLAELSEVETARPIVAGLPSALYGARAEPRDRETSEALPEAPLIDRRKRQEFRALRFDPDEAEFDALGQVLAALDRGETPPARAARRAEAAAAPKTPSPARASTKAPDARELAALTRKSLAEPPKATKPEPKPDPVEAKDPALSMKPVRIVLDPGHGGRDPGTADPSIGVMEKTVVLAFAQELLALLREDPDYDVSATRETDRFVRLENRVAFARERDADLMISIHADWFSDPSIKGATAYTLSEEASMRSAEEVVSGKQKAESVAGIDIDAEREDVVRVLLDLTRRETQTQSQRFAELVVDEFDTVTSRVRGVRDHDLHVLRTPDLPAVLIELGFMSNLEDRRQMQSPEWRRATAKSVKRALDRWRVERGAREFARR